MIEHIRIPPDRIGSLIGVNGSVKEFIEENCEVEGWRFRGNQGVDHVAG